MASGPYLAWLPLKFLHAFDPDLRPPAGELRTPPLPRTGFIARRSAEDLASFRLLRQAVRDAALEEKRKTAGVDRSHLSAARRMVTAPPFVAATGHVVRVPEIPGGFPALPGGLLSGAGCCQV